MEMCRRSRTACCLFTKFMHRWDSKDIQMPWFYLLNITAKYLRQCNKHAVDRLMTKNKFTWNDLKITNASEIATFVICFINIYKNWWDWGLFINKVWGGNLFLVMRVLRKKILIEILASISKQLPKTPYMYEIFWCQRT